MSAEHPPDDNGFYPTFAALLETPEERKEWVEALLDRVYGKTRCSEQSQAIASALGDALPSEYPLFQKSVNHAH